MKMNKKGFTLIELLAVIVILAIVALVATPIVMTTVDNARAGAAKASANNVITAINNNEQLAAFGSDTENVLNTSAISSVVTESVEGAEVTHIKALSSSVKFSGDEPTFIELSVDEDKIVTKGCMIISNYIVQIKEGKAATAEKAGTASTCTPAA